MKPNITLHRILIFLLPILILTSCEAYLDIKPAGKLIPQKGNVKAFGNLLNNESTVSGMKDNNSYFFPAFLTDDLEISDLQADYIWKDGASGMYCYFAHIFQQPYFDPNLSDYFWNQGIYKPVLFFNSCINGVKGVITPETEAEGNEIIAQATIARAYCFLMGTMLYGPVYRPGGDNSRKTIPYRTSSGVMDPMEDLSTHEEVFERVLSDIHQSLPHLSDAAVANTRFGKVQAYTLLAYYHLFTAKHDSVAFYADKALALASSQFGGMDNLFYDYNLFSWADPAIAEDPDLRYGGRFNTPQGTEAVNSSLQLELCLYREGGWRGGGDYYDYPSENYLSLFDAETDLRREYVYFELDGFSTIVGKDTLSDGRRIFGMDRWLDCLRFTEGFSYPEILLMRAEGRARTGNTAGALEDLNYLRKLRHKTGTPPLNISGQDNVIMEVLNERRRELPIASSKRFLDLKRLCLETGKPWCKESITHVVKGVSYTQKIDSEYFILPISNEILKFNPQWGIPLEETLWTNTKKK